MSNFDPAAMSLDSLAQTFAEKARVVPSSGNRDELRGKKLTPYGLKLQDDIGSLAAELVKRNGVAQARALMHHENRNVRGWAADRLFSLDWGLSSIASASVIAGISTREVVAYARLARRGPPAGPGLDALDVPQLLARYEEAGARRYAVKFVTDDDDFYNTDLRNSIVSEMNGVASELERRGALPALAPMMDHANVSVRSHAAIYLLSDMSEKAEAVLRAIEPDGLGFEHDEVVVALVGWDLKTGKLKVDRSF